MPFDRSIVTLLILAPLLSCNVGGGKDYTGAGLGGGDDKTGDGDGATSGGSGDEGESGNSGSGGDDGGGDDGGPPKFDVSPGEGSGGDEEDGCQKVDFLFVVDNSGSMEDEQQNLINSFPGFIEQIAETLNADDYQIMVISTDNGEGGGMNTSCSNGVCNCIPAPLCCENACSNPSYTCNGFDCGNLPITECDRTWGAGKMWDAEGNFCDPAEGRRYMIDGQPEVATTFECMANVGTYGSGLEKPMLATVSAAAADINGAGGCNEGFLRDDAILVLTLITDEEDDMADPDAPGSPGDPPDWVQAVIDAKYGNDKAVVALGLLDDCESADSLCAPCGDPNSGEAGAERSPRLHEFITSFPYHVLGSICAPDYTQFFIDATSIIDLSCDEFFPPG
jgi:hypothetical protein